MEIEQIIEKIKGIECPRHLIKANAWQLDGWIEYKTCCSIGKREVWVMLTDQEVRYLKEFQGLWADS